MIATARKLASIERIHAIEPIKDADNIELAHVLGWQCVVNKGQFKRLDTAVYFEIDSFLPIRPEFEFLRSSSYAVNPFLGEGFRLKTKKFRGQISQGLLLPVSSFKEIPEGIEVGTNVAALLGVQQWQQEERATTGGTTIGSLPASIPHTDETRVQSKPELIDQFANYEYYISTKMDGSSHSISVDSNGFHVTGHNYEYKDDGCNSFYNFVNKRGYRSKIEEFAVKNKLASLTIQGEFCAPGIQGNRLRLNAPEWYVFTVMENGKRVGLNRMTEICSQLCLTMVPIEEVGNDLPSKYPTVDSLLERADGYYKNGGKKEGIVIRTTEPVYSDTNSSYLSMKVVSNKYLLKNGD